MSVASLPKVELHLHLDCSLSYDVVKRLKPGTSWEEYRYHFVAPAKCTDLSDYIQRAVSPIALMQRVENLRLVTLDLFKQLEADHVIYSELRFAPLEHLREGLDPRKVVETVNEAVEEGCRATGIPAGIILCTLRNYSREKSMKTVQLVDLFKGSHVVGFDIAADEAGFPIDNHIEAFEYASQQGIKCTAHAGEAKGPSSVWETLDHLKPLRIGHGVRSAEDPALLRALKERDIHLEVCPTSNVQTDIFPTLTHHNIDDLFRMGMSLSVNTDCRTISDVTLGSEYSALAKVFGWSPDHFLKCNREAIRHAFSTDDLKEKLLQKLEQGYSSIK